MRCISMRQLKNKTLNMAAERQIVCTPCLRDRDVAEETVKYCVECNVNLCKACLKEHIKKTSSSVKAHTLLVSSNKHEHIFQRGFSAIVTV